jgi:hypothetical protein
MLFSVFACQFQQFRSSGELATHNKAGRIALWISLILNTGYSGLCFYEAYVAGGTLVSSFRLFFLLPLTLYRSRS